MMAANREAPAWLEDAPVAVVAVAGPSAHAVRVQVAGWRTDADDYFVPVLALVPDAALGAMALDAGAAAFLVEPVEAATGRAQVRALARNHAAMQELRTAAEEGRALAEPLRLAYAAAEQARAGQFALQESLAVRAWPDSSPVRFEVRHRRGNLPGGDACDAWESGPASVSACVVTAPTPALALRIIRELMREPDPAAGLTAANRVLLQLNCRQAPMSSAAVVRVDRLAGRVAFARAGGVPLVRAGALLPGTSPALGLFAAHFEGGTLTLQRGERLWLGSAGFVGTSWPAEELPPGEDEVLLLGVRFGVGTEADA